MTSDYSSFFKVFTEVSKAIHSGEESEDILESIVTHIKDILGAKGSIYWLVDENSQTIIQKFSHGFSYRSLESVEYDVLQGIFDKRQGHVSFIEDARNDPRIPDLERFGKRRVGSITALFFDIVGSYSGILAIYFNDQRPLNQEEYELVNALGEQGAIALDRAITHGEKMVKNLRQVVEGLTLALEAKDRKTHGHSVQVARFARMVAQEMGLSKKEVETIYHGGLLHDIGKIGMEDDILERLGILSPNEMHIIMRHPEVGANIMRPLLFLNDLVPLILHHHERFDGTGYPNGLKGAKIPLGARILTVCDVFETMLAGRIHFERLKFEDAVLNLQQGSGTQFDPEVLSSLFKALLNNPEVLDLNDMKIRCVKNHLEKIKRPVSFQGAAMF